MPFIIIIFVHELPLLELKVKSRVFLRYTCTYNIYRCKIGTEVVLAQGVASFRRRKRDITSETEEDDDHFFSEDDYEHDELYYDFHYDMSEAKRTSPEDEAVLPSWPTKTGITEAQARAKCKAVLVDSAVGKTCGELDIGVDDRMDECVMDIRVRQCILRV